MSKFFALNRFFKLSKNVTKRQCLNEYE